MQAILKGNKNPFRSLEAAKAVCLLTALTICVGAMVAGAQSSAGIIATQNNRLVTFSSGGWGGQAAPTGGSFAVDRNGNVLVGTTWGGTVLMINTITGTSTAIVSGFNNVEPLALDGYGNLYIGQTYGAGIVKLPFNPATGQYAAYSGTPTVTCAGNTGKTADTAACNFALNLQDSSGYYGIAAMAFDPMGNFWVAVNQWPGKSANNSTINNSILMCNQACQYSAQYTAQPTTVYADPVQTDAIGGLAFDPWGNLFFTDDAIDETGPSASSQSVTTSGLYEVAYNASNQTYAAAPTTLVTYTNTQSYNNGIFSVVADSSGTIYYVTPADGIFAIPNSSTTGPSVSGTYQVATVGGKGLAIDSHGNLYSLAYSSGDGVTQILENNLPLGASPVSTAAKGITATIIDNAAGCSPAPAITAAVTEGAVTSTEFSAKVGSCSTGGGPIITTSTFPVTVGFTPTTVGERSAALTFTDTTNNAAGSAVASGTGQGAFANLDPGVWTSFTSGFTTPAGAAVDAAGDVFVADSGAGMVFEIQAGQTTPAAVGSGFVHPTGLAFSVAGDLYIADAGVPAVFKISNTGTKGAFVAGQQKTLLDKTALFGGGALTSPMALAFGPDQILYIADAGLKEVVTYSLISHATGITSANASNGVEAPVGVAADGANNLYVADGEANAVFAFWAGGGVTSVAPSSVLNPAGVAVDASGSLIISDKSTGNIVRVPNESGTLTTSDALTIESLPTQALGMTMDWAGNLYVADGANQAVYAIQRTAASINLGTVEDGNSNTEQVWLMNAGNQAATLGSPAITQPANTMFTVNPGSAAKHACSDGGSGPAGQYCEFDATFAPPANTGGAETGTATLTTNAADSPNTINLSATASKIAIVPQAITGFNPPTAMNVGQQTTLSATGGASGNPVTFSIDVNSSCGTCATLAGNVLTATAPGRIIVDANQAGGTVNNVNYSAAPEVQVHIAISTLPAPGGPGSGILTSQLTWLGAYPNGGDLAGGVPAGDSFAINSHGNVLVSTTYGGSVAEIDGQTGAVTTLGSYGKYGNTGGVAVDSQDNLYIGALYSNMVVKLPYVGGSANGGYAPLTDASSAATPPANCTGSDTTECVVAPISNLGGIAAMKFDAQGDLFIVTSDQSNPHEIYECTAACLAGGTGAPVPVMLYQAATGTGTGAGQQQTYLGGIAVDPSGNLFFNDSNFTNQSGNQNITNYSDVYELPYTAGTGYAKTAILLQTFTPYYVGSYNDGITGVATDASGNVYYTSQWDGTYALPNVSGTINTAGGYIVSTQGGKGLSYDASGNLYVSNYSTAIVSGGAETVGRISVNNVVAPISPIGVAATIKNITAMDNYVGCSTPATIGITSSNAQFSATAGTTCSSDAVGNGNGTMLHAASGSNFPVSVTFTPTAAGPQTGTLTLTDSTNGGQGTATVTGTGQETAQTINFTAPASPVTFSPSLQITLTATGGGSGNPVVFTIDTTSTATGTISGNTVTVTGAGNLVIDANQIGGLVNDVYYAAAAQVQQTIVISPAPQTINFTAPTSPVTFAPNLQIALTATGGASGNTVVFTVDTSSTGTGTISGDTLTVTGAGNLVIDANQAGNTDYAAATQVQQTIVVNQASQTITFTPPPPPIYFVAGGITINLVATGGASGNPVVFTVDKSSTGAGTIKGSVLTVTAQGNLVIDGNQAGNNNYAAAAQAQETIDVLPPLPTQTITFNNPGTQVVGVPLTLAASASSGFVVSFASSTTSVCTVSGTTATFVAAGNCTITASQPGDNKTYAPAPSVSQTFIVNPAGVIPSVNLSFSLSQLTLAPTDTGLTTLTINSQNSFTGQVSFACSGLPSGYTCVFNPNPVTVLPDQAATTNLSVVPGGSAALHQNSRPILPAATLAIALCFLGFRKRNRLQLLLLVVMCVTGLGVISGCGGTSSTAKAKATTTQVTVTATSGSVKSSATLTLIVE